MKSTWRVSVYSKLACSYALRVHMIIIMSLIIHHGQNCGHSTRTFRELSFVFYLAVARQGCNRWPCALTECSCVDFLLSGFGDLGKSPTNSIAYLFKLTQTSLTI